MHAADPLNIDRAPALLRLPLNLAFLLAGVGNALHVPRSPGGNPGVVALAATPCGNGNFQLFSQDASNKLLFWRSVAGVRQNSPQALPLTVEAKPSTPLAAVSWQDAGNDIVCLYYIGAGNQIANICGTCLGATCTWGKPSSGTIHPGPASSGLAATYLQNTKTSWGVRIYYLESNGAISQLAWDSGRSAWGRTPNIGGVKATANSNLAVSVQPSTTDLQVYYISQDKSISQTFYNSQFSAGSVIGGDLGSAARPVLAAAALSSPPNRFLYYIDQNKAVQQLQYQDGAWLSKPTSPSVLPPADAATAPIAAAAWGTNVRLYYLSGGDIVEWDMNSSGQWSAVGNSPSNSPPVAGNSPSNSPPVAGNSSSDHPPGTPISTIGGVVGVVVFVICVTAAVLGLRMRKKRQRLRKKVRNPPGHGIAHMGDDTKALLEQNRAGNAPMMPPSVHEAAGSTRLSEDESGSLSGRPTAWAAV